MAKTLPTSGVRLSSKYADDKGRLYFYDNAKFLLIFLVVLGHTISPFSEAGEGRLFYLLLWRTINTLHMPCMIFISGFFAKSYIRLDGSINLQRPFTYALYYIVAQVAFTVFDVFVLGKSRDVTLLDATSSLWFLVCLIWWHLLLPVISKIKPKYMLPIAIVAGLLIGYDENVGNFLSFSRMITHFPSFLLGFYISEDSMRKLSEKKSKLLSVPLVIIAVSSIALTIYLKEVLGVITFSINSFITCNESYFSIFKNSGVNSAFWFLPRVWFYLCALALGFSFLVWAPKSKNIFTRFGARTLAPYLLHRCVYQAYRRFDWDELAWLPGDNEFLLRLFMILVAFAVTVILSTKPFYLPFELLGRIKIKKLLKDADKKT